MKPNVLAMLEYLTEELGVSKSTVIRMAIKRFHDSVKGT